MATAKTTMPTTKTKTTKTTKAKTTKAKPVGTTTATATRTAKVVPLNREDLQAQIATLKADLAELTSSLKEQGVEYVDAKTADLRATASEKTAELRTVATQKAEIAKDKYADTLADTEARIRANPLTSVAIAVGAGLVLGAITRR